MTTISIPLPKILLDFVDSLIKTGVAENRAQAVRSAIRLMQEEMEINEIFEASRQVEQGRVYRGELASILKNRKKNG